MSNNTGPLFLNPVARARGLGAAGEGTHHWWTQRLTSMALVPLSLWFAFSMARLAGADLAAVKAFFASNPCNPGLAILFVAIACHHGAAGIEVIAEDYIYCKTAKLTTIIGVKFLCAVLAMSCIMSILKLALGA